jgi:ABC-type lipoprotein export system ATPase subunit
MIIELRKVIPLPLLEIDHGDSEIWEKESLIFEAGDRVLLSAPSGKGKTTFLSMIYGLRNDYQGDVILDGLNINKIKPLQLAFFRKRKLSYIFQGLELFDELTAMENIQLKNRMTNYKSVQDILELAEILGISRFMNRKAGILSFGQKQRVAIIRALCQPFEFLLADEIFSHMDEVIRQKALDVISEELKKRAAGILFTSLKESENGFFNKKYRV